jgi:hypothetical protein
VISPSSADSSTSFGQPAQQPVLTNIGTETEFLASLKGANGKDGKDGRNGESGTAGIHIITAEFQNYGGFFYGASVMCPKGEVVTGGGHNIWWHPSPGTVFTIDGPAGGDGLPSTTMWTVRMKIPEGGTMQTGALAYAICAPTA